MGRHSRNRKYSTPGNPYNIALGFGLERIFLHLKSLGCNAGVTFFLFESRGKKEDKDLELEFRRLCSRNETGHQLPFDIILADKRCNSAGLQLVDLIARPIGACALTQNYKFFLVIHSKKRLLDRNLIRRDF